MKPFVGPFRFKWVGSSALVLDSKDRAVVSVFTGSIAEGPFEADDIIAIGESIATHLNETSDENNQR